MERVNIIYTSAVPGAKDSFKDVINQETICRRYLFWTCIGNVNNIVVLNELHSGEKRPVFESLKTLIEHGWVNTVTIRSIDGILDTEDAEELSILGMEFETGIYFIDIELTGILAMFDYDATKGRFKI